MNKNSIYSLIIPTKIGVDFVKFLKRKTEYFAIRCCLFV